MTVFDRLEEALASDPEKDHLDYRFFAISTDMEKGEYATAQGAIEALFNEGYYDVRLICYSLYIDLMSRGVEAIRATFDSLKAVLTTHWEKIYPIKDRENQARSGLNWFFNLFDNYLKHTEIQVTAGIEVKFWTKALALGAEEIDEAVVASEEAKAFFATEWKDTAIVNKLSDAINWLEKLKSAASRSVEVKDEGAIDTDVIAEATPKELIEVESSRPMSHPPSGHN